MKATRVTTSIRFLPCLALPLLAACASNAPGFGGRWQQANRYPQKTQEIPLQQAYVFAPSPMDGTLRSMLQRWTHDAGMALQYEHRADYTLYAGVEKIATPDLRQAASLLNEAYAAQGIAITLEQGRVIVRPAATLAQH